MLSVKNGFLASFQSTLDAYWVAAMGLLTFASMMEPAVFI